MANTPAIDDHERADQDRRGVRAGRRVAVLPPPVDRIAIDVVNVDASMRSISWMSS